ACALNFLTWPAWAPTCVFWLERRRPGAVCLMLCPPRLVPIKYKERYMFTGIVAAVGTITRAQPLGEGGRDDGLRLVVHAPGFSLDATKLGDSIAIQGACMTVVELSNDSFSVDVSRESLNLTVGLDAPGEVNLEHALRLGDSLDGHLVSGHVDGLGTVASFEPVGESWDLR